MASQTSNHRRHELTPLGPSRKRKDRDVFDAHRGAPVATKSEPAPPPAPAQRKQQQHQPAPPSGSGGGGSNRLLAGYLAHEFITKGTLFGQRWDPAAAATKPPAPYQPALLPKPQQQKPKQPAPPEPKQGKPPPAYAEVAYLLKTDAAHIPGVVNPTQLARLLRM